MTACPFLDRLPVEIRLTIYEYLLPHDQELKLRQYVPGSRNLAILRASRQIYQEAIPELYESNTIVVTRNDFCKCTDANLRTPVKLEYARHLFVASFSQSIACTLAGPEGRCEVCQSNARGLIDIFAAMPRLRTVVVDYSKHIGEMWTFRQDTELEGELELSRMSPAPLCSLTLRVPGLLRDVEVKFQNGTSEKSSPSPQLTQ